MSIDQSIQNANQSAIRIADSLLRANGATSVSLLVPPAIGDASDAGQMGINTPNFQQLPLSPAIFRKNMGTKQKDGVVQYELLVSAAAIDQQINALDLTSADALFDTVAGVLIDGAQFAIESHSVSEIRGHAYLYRLVLSQSAF